MLRTMAVLVLMSLAAIAPSADKASAGPLAMRTVLVVPQGTRFAPRSVGRRDCIAYPRNCVNGVGGVEVTYAVSGKPPLQTQIGRVLTDTNCQADSYGVSHCLNRIRLASGRELTVRHDHSMMNDPCLVPGERVRIRSTRQSSPSQ